jgi:hypothetical protein
MNFAKRNNSRLHGIAKSTAHKKRRRGISPAPCPYASVSLGGGGEIVVPPRGGALGAVESGTTTMLASELPAVPAC